MNSRTRIGDLLVEAGIISVKTLERALALQKVSGKRLGALLREMGIVTEEEVIEALARQCDLKVVKDFARQQFPKKLLDLVPKRLAVERIVFPLKRYKGILSVAILDPFDKATIDTLIESTGMRIYPMLATRDEICSAIERHYGGEHRETSCCKTILIVDPSQKIGKMFETALVREGFEVLIATDGIDGLKVAFTRRPRMILCDSLIPRMDSLNFLHALKAHPETASVPVILMGSRPGKEEEKNALNEGFDDFIGKPATPMHLAARVKNLFSLSETNASPPEKDVTRGRQPVERPSSSL
jgi:CheY-like chemotaxis protein